MPTFRKLRDDVIAFHEDERGESSTLSNVMMLAVAAIAVIALLAFGKVALEWLGKQWNKIKDGKMDSGAKNA